MQIQNVPITSVKPYEKNPRFNDDAVDAVAKSIKEFGWQQPIVVDSEMVVIAGHTRLKAAERLGLTEVPVVVPFRDLAGLVVGDAVGLDLFRRQVVRDDDRHFREAEAFGGLQSCVAGNDDHLGVDDDGLLPAELLDGFCHPPSC